jgi:hypothetical protein
MGEGFPQGQEPPVPENQQWGMISPDMSEQMEQAAQQASGQTPEEYAARLEEQKQNMQGLNVSTERSEPLPESTTRIEVVDDEPTAPVEEAAPVQEMEHNVEHDVQEDDVDGNNEQPHEEQNDERVQDPEFAHEMANKEAPLQEMLSRLKTNRNVPESVRKQSMEDLTKEIKELEQGMERRREVQEKVVGDQAKEAVVNIQKFAAEHPEGSTPNFDELLGSDDWEDAWDSMDDVSNIFRNHYGGDYEMEGAVPLDSKEFGKAGAQLSEVVKSLVGAKDKPSIKFNSDFGESGGASFMELYETEYGTLIVQESFRAPDGVSTKMERASAGATLTKMSPDQVVKLYEKANLEEGEHFNLSRR